MTLHFYYGGVFFTNKRSSLGDRENFGILFYEHVDQPFTLYQFYLESFDCVAFNSLNEKILPVILRGFNDNDRNKKQTYNAFKEKVTKNIWNCLQNYFICVYIILISALIRMFLNIFLFFIKILLVLSRGFNENNRNKKETYNAFKQEVTKNIWNYLQIYFTSV